MSTPGVVPQHDLEPVEWSEHLLQKGLCHYVIYSDVRACRTHVVLATKTSMRDSSLIVVNAAKEQGFIRVQQTQFMVGGLHICFVRNTGGLEILFVDLLDDRTLLLPLPGDIDPDKVHHVTDEEQLKFLLACSIRNLPLTPEQSERAAQLASRLPEQSVLSILRSLCGGNRKIAAPNSSIRNRLRYWCSLARNQPKSVAYYACRKLLRRAPLETGRRGMFVVMLGPDGAGKSTAKTALINAYAPLFTEILSWHWRPGLIWPVGPATPLRRPHAKQPRPTMLSLFYLAAVFLDTWAGYLRYGRAVLNRGGLITCDRYFRDVLVDPLRYRYKGPPWIPRLLGNWVPRPDLEIVLDADEKVMFDRKPELTVEELRRQRFAYAQLVQSASPARARLLRSDHSIEQTSQDVVNSVMVFLSSRTASQDSIAHRVGRS